MGDWVFYYKAYGLTIESDFPINEFISFEPDCSTQVFFRYGNIPLPHNKIHFRQRRIIAHRGGILLYWKKIGSFLVQDGCHVTVSPHKSTKGTSLINSIIIGAVMGTILLQRRAHYVFHSSVVGKDDSHGAVALMALSGGGKSTMATAMINRGYSLVCDDLLVLKRANDPLTVQAGFPGMKLWRSSAKALVDKGEDLPMIGKKGQFEKRNRSLRDNFLDKTLPLNSIFLLNFDRVDKPIINRLNEQAALAELMPHWYGSLFGGDLLPILGNKRLFESCSFLAQATPIYRLTRPFGLDRLDETVELVDQVRLNMVKEGCRD
jgi:hypothetical protein